ncbi:MAG: FtsK/SpoIIIE domain-containing protein [Alphaproteobacteria bacterium]|nr:FtsK/SpoIIIE domain-containing protein [Alphaproteobacteria bacterium]
MSTPIRFLPESVSQALKSLAVRVLGIVLLAVGIGLIIALLRFDPWLAGYGTVSNFGRQSIFGNIVGLFIHGIGFLPALFVFLYIVRLGATMTFSILDASPEYNFLRSLLTVAFGAAGLGSIMPTESWGGLAGVIVAHDLARLIGMWGAFGMGIVFLGIFAVLAGILLRVKWGGVRTVFRAMLYMLNWTASVFHLTRTKSKGWRQSEVLDCDDDEESEEIKERVPRKRTVAAKKKSLTVMHHTVRDDFKLPLPEFLEKSVFARHTVTNELKRTAFAMESNFEQYGVYGKVEGIKPGPIVTLYEFEPDPGMRIKAIADTVKDMTRAMAAENIRIAPIPRTRYIGVEMVNMDRQTVRFQTFITNNDFIHSRYHIPLALGVDIGGHPVYFDLAKMPHVLIAGRTGSGKSVFVQSIIMSILYHFRPDECKMVIVDPKGVDFTLWRDIPHLVTPIVTDAGQAVNALKWTVREMEERYKKLKDIGVQNIEGYNEAVAALRAKNKKITKQVAIGTDPETGELEYEEREVDLSDMPYLVVVIDEVADLMSVARKEVEAAVQRLAQKARAAGIHLVMATQRPDTSVITGVIKANFPTRISFQARSNIDSMTTLGEKGAEQLLACGDMLFSEAGRVPVRIHGAFIENKEINKVADFLRKQGEPEYVQGVGDGEDSSGNAVGGFDGIPDALPGGRGSRDSRDGDLYRQAVEYVIRDKKPTISYIQRRLGIGYNKAATFIERMESEGIVSPPDANNKRHIL